MFKKRNNHIGDNVYVVCHLHLLLIAILRSMHSPHPGEPQQSLAILDSKSRHDRYDDNRTSRHDLSTTSKALAQQRLFVSFRGEITFERPKHQDGFPL